MRLIHRILLLILVAVSVSSMANLLLTQYQQKTLHNDSEKILARTIVQSLRDALVQDVIDGNKLRVTNLLRSIEGHDNPIEYLYVTDTEQSIFAHSFKQGFPRYLAQQKKQHSTLPGIHLDHKYQTENGLIYEYSEVLIAGLDATLHIGINQSEIAETLADNSKYILEASLVMMLLALSFAYLWGKQMTAPLAEFAHQIKLFGAGNAVNFNRQKKAAPEIRELASAFHIATEERQQAINALQKREQDLAITLNSIGDAVITTDPKGLITRMNPVAERLTHWSFEEAQGLSVKTVFPIINASTLEPIENPIEKVLLTGKTIYLSNDTTLIAKDGSKYQISDSAAPIRDKDNNIQGMVLIFNDVTEKYQLKSNINKQLERFKELSNLALTMTGKTQGIFNNISGIICRLLEVKAVYLSEVRGDKLYFLSVCIGDQIHNDTGFCDLSTTPCSTVERDKDIRIYQQVIELFPEATYLKDNNAYSYCGFPALDSTGKVVAVTCLLDDKPHEFTEQDQDLLRIFGQRIGLELEHLKIQDKLKKQEEQLRLSQKMDALGKLTGGIAHDYNNMLGVITGYAELLEEALSNQPKLAKYAHEIYRAGGRGSKLTNKLLTFSRQKTSEPDRLNINTLLQNQQDMLKKTLTVRINLVFDLEKDLWPVWLDDSDLEDAILNMSINAMHAIEGNGQLTIQTRNEHVNEPDALALGVNAGDYVVLSIADTGCGIDEAVKESIFDPFYSTKGSKGTGLGLSQVYGFVDHCNGAIKVYSELNHGTQFKLYFPRCLEDTDDKQAERVKQFADVKGNETILIVDDEPALRELTCEMLNLHGYNTISAENGNQALHIIENETVHLLLTDIIMPEMDGYQLATIVQKRYPTLKIQLASGFADDRHADMVEDRLQNNLLYKPFNSQALLQRIRELLAEKS